METENQRERARWSHLIEVYAPVRHDLDGRILAINEFYLLPDAWKRSSPMPDCERG